MFVQRKNDRFFSKSWILESQLWHHRPSHAGFFFHFSFFHFISIEQMLAVNPGKTPISLLQEYGTRIGKTPVYDLLKAEGQAHQPNFTFRVSVGDISCTGQGPSKKAAKHKAAEAALKMLKGGLGGPAGFGVGVDGFVGVDVTADGDRSVSYDVFVFVISSTWYPDKNVNVALQEQDEGHCDFVTSSFEFVLSYLLHSSHSEMKTSGTSQQSECNPVGALQVNKHRNFHFAYCLTCLLIVAMFWQSFHGLCYQHCAHCL